MVTDREKVIKGLERCTTINHFDITTCCDCPYEDANNCCNAVMRDALELLKEQEAVEPTLIREGRNKYYNNYVCPGCGTELYYYGQNYCSECGRSVKWE